MKWNRLVTAVVFVSGVLFVQAGCGSKKELDQAVDMLVEALQKNDYSKFKKITSSALAEEVERKKMDDLSTAIRNLGAFQDRTMRSINLEAGVKKSGSYVLTFEKGRVNLEIVLRDGKISSFNFFGEAMDKAYKHVLEDKYREFAVRNFQFQSTDGSPNPGGNAYGRGSKINFTMTVQGLTQKEGEYHVKLHLKVFDPRGKMIAQQQNFMDKTVKAVKRDAPVVEIKGYLFSGAEAGTYNIKFTVEDANDGRTINYSQSVVVQ